MQQSVLITAMPAPERLRGNFNSFIKPAGKQLARMLAMLTFIFIGFAPFNKLKAQSSVFVSQISGQFSQLGLGQFSLSFSGMLTGLSTSNFSVSASGGVTSPVIVGVNPGGQGYTVSVEYQGGGGTVTLTLNNSNGCTPSIMNVPSSGSFDAPGFSTSGTPASLSTIAGTASSSTSFTVSSGYLESGINMQAPTGFELSTDNVNFSSVITVGTAGTLSPTTIYLRLSAGDAGGTYSGYVACSSFFAANVSVPVGSSTVITPVISASGTLSALSTTSGVASSSTGFSVSGTNMPAGILVSPPAGFEVSTDNTNFSNTVTVGSAGTIATTPVYVRLAAADAANTYAGNVALTSGSAAEVDVAIPTSTVIAVAPTTAATAAAFTATTATATTASWTNGNGAARAVFMYAGSSGSPAPVNSTNYNANAAFGSGDQIGSTGWYCVYNGTGSTVNVTGLAASTTYQVMAVEYNGTSSTIAYLTTAGTGNPAGVTTLTPTISTTGTPAALTTTSGTASSSTSFHVSGVNLTAGNLTVTAPAGFDVSADNATWSASGGSFTIAETGTLASTPVYIRLDAADAINSYSGNVVISGGGAASINEATASSAVVVAPTLSYSSPQSYNTGTAVSLAPTSSGVAAQAYNPTPVILGSGISNPAGVAVDAAGNVYVADYGNNDIKEIPAGNGTPAIIGSGFNLANGVAVDAAGNVYVADTHNSAVKEIPAGNGTPVTIGSGFSLPTGIAVDAAGNVYVADPGKGAVYEIPAGNGVPVTLGSGFSGANRVAVDAAGNVYVGDYGNNAVKEIPAGNGTPVTLGSGFSQPDGVAVDAAGNVYVADNGNNAVKEIPAGNGAPITIGSGFSSPDGVAVDAAGNLYIADSGNNAVKEITPRGGYYADLPTGLLINSNTGVISGIPTTASAATNYTVAAYNSAGLSATAIVNIAVVLTPPTIAATNLSFTNTTIAATTISWANGNGTSRAVFMAAATSGNPGPVNLTAYAANTVFGSGAQIGATGWYCVYNGNGSMANITGLTTNTTYQAMVLEYNGTGSTVDYLTTAGSGNPTSVTTLLGLPAISSFSPVSGPVGSSIIISGSGFNATAANNIVFFGATMATVTAASNTSLTVTVPAGATYAPITVLDGANHLSCSSRLPFVITFSGAGGINTSTLSAPQTFATGTAPSAVAIADIDGDGKPDIVVISKTDRTFGVLLNTSAGGSITSASFAAQKTISTGTSTPTSIAISDLDGDGKLDVVIGSSSGNSLVFHNTSTPGNISFGARLALNPSQTPSTVAVADFDGDGKPDIAVYYSTARQVYIFRNTTPSGGTISFASAAGVNLTNGTISLTAADLNGDGKPDLIGLNTDARAEILENTSSGGTLSFATEADFALGSLMESMAISDVDGDGKLDIVANAATVVMLRNTSSPGGAISFAAFKAIPIATGVSFNGIAMNDMDGDGKPDLIASGNNDQLYLLSNTSSSGSPSFATPVLFAAGTAANSLSSLAIGDLDGDGKPDIAVDAYADNKVDILQNLSVGAAAIYAAGTPAALSTTSGTASSSTNFYVTGASVTGNITVAAPAGFDVSADNATWTSVGGSYTISPANSTIATTPVYVRLDAADAGNTYAGNVAITGGGATEVDVAIPTSIVLAAAPTTQATNLTFTGTTATATTASWTNGGGTARAVFMAAATSGSPAPVNYTAYNANAAFASGDQIGSTGWYCVYNGTGSTVNVTGLSAGTTYQAMVVEYNGTGNLTGYLTTPGTGNPAGVTTPTTVASITPVGTSPTNATTLDYTVTFASALTTPPSTGDFALTGTATGTVNSVTGSGTTYDVNVTNVSGNGALELDMTAAADVSPAISNVPFTGGSYTIQTGQPVANVISISSSNANSSAQAIPGDVVTLSFTTNVAVNTPVVTIENQTVTPTSADHINWTAAYTVLASNGAGPAQFSVQFTDLAGNTSATYSTTSDGSAVNILSNDNTLSALSVSQGAISPQFSAGQTNYTETLNYDGSLFTVTATPDDANATISYTLNSQQAASNQFQLLYGTNSITITVTARDGLTNTYTLTVTANLQPETITFNAPPAATYGGADFSPAATSDNSNVAITYSSDNGAVATIVNGSIHIVTAGTANITATQAGDATHAAANNVTQQLTVSPAQLIITANSASINYGDPVPTFTAGYNTFVNGDDNTKLTTQPQFSTSATTGSAPGPYTIYVSGAADPNYNISYQSGTLTIAGSSDATLSGITINTVAGISASGPNTYQANVVNGVTSVILTPATSNAQATMKVNNNPTPSGTPVTISGLTTGNNTVTIVVTAQNGAVQTYTVTITRAQSGNANLLHFAISNGTLSPTFATGTVSYTAGVVNGIAAITVTPTVVDATATIMVNNRAVTSGAASQSLPLSVGPNTINTVVTAQNGTTKTYTLVVTEAKSSNDNLSDLKTGTGTLSPAFLSATTGYSESVANTVSTITITPTTTVNTSTVTVNTLPATSGAASTVSLAVGLNTIPVTVTAQDGSIKTYMVSITRAASTNASLAGLTASTGALSPAFATGTYSYSTANVANGVTSITVTPTTADPTATILINNTIVATSGNASQSLPLAVGPNTITIVVTAQDNATTLTYTITVNRAASAIATLSSLQTSNGILSPGFGVNTFSYTASVVNGVTATTITPTTTDPTATITVNTQPVTSGSPSGAIALSVGANTITTVVTAQNGTVKMTYTVTITRAESSNDKLTSLKVSRGTLSPTFVQTTTGYAVSVVNGVSSMTITPTIADPNATMLLNGTTAIASGATSDPIALAVGSNTITVTVTAQDNVTNETYTLTVTRAASSVDSYNPGISVVKPGETLTLADDGILVHQAISPNGDGINDFLQIDNINQYPDNKLTIMNRNGQLVYEASGYDNTSKVFDGHSNKNGQMQLPGTYFYQLDYTVNGITKHKTGFLVLKY